MSRKVGPHRNSWAGLTQIIIFCSDENMNSNEDPGYSISYNFVECISKDKGKSIEEVEELLNGGPYKMNELVDGEWITQCKYLNEIEDMLKVRTGGRSDVFQSVGFAKYSSVPQSIFAGSAKHTIAVVRSSGAISRTSSATSNGISSATFIKSINRESCLIPL